MKKRVNDDPGVQGHFRGFSGLADDIFDGLVLAGQGGLGAQEEARCHVRALRRR